MEKNPKYTYLIPEERYHFSCESYPLNKIDELVKRRKTPFFVIPAKAGIQFINWLQSFCTPPELDPGSTGLTTFYETIKVKSLLQHWHDRNVWGLAL